MALLAKTTTTTSSTLQLNIKSYLSCCESQSALYTAKSEILSGFPFQDRGRIGINTNSYYDWITFGRIIHGWENMRSMEEL